MHLWVFPNGYGKEEGKYMSVFTCLVKGENDDKLKWPLRGSITIQLLDQSGNDNHEVLYLILLVFVDFMSSPLIYMYMSKILILAFMITCLSVWCEAYFSSLYEGGAKLKASAQFL